MAAFPYLVNFVPPQPLRLTGWGAFALGIGVLALSASLWHYDRNKNELNKNLQMVAELQARHVPLRAIAPPLAEDMVSVKQWQAAVMQLNLPWPAMFASLEEAQSPHISMLAIEPDARAGWVRVTALARNSNDLQDYVRKLQHTQGLDHVLLESYKQQSSAGPMTGGPLMPSGAVMPISAESAALRFTLRAKWMGPSQEQEGQRQ